MRPGPDSIEPGRAPDGIVLQVYDLAGVRLIEQRLVPGVDVEHMATAAAANVSDRVDQCVLVAFDGDTGARMSLRDWLTK